MTDPADTPPDYRSLAGRVALVAGVGPGIGRACALACAADGAAVVLGARDTARLAEIADEVRATGADVVALPTDITDPAQVGALVGAAVTLIGVAVAQFARRGDPARSVESIGVVD